MDELPELQHADLRGELQRLYSAGREHHLFAFYGTGSPGEIALSKGPPVEVVPIRSELDLRAQLPRLDDHQTRRAYLVPWAGDMPLDIRHRFANRGRILRVGRDARLMRLFGASEYEKSALRSKLATYLLRPGNPSTYGQGGGRLNIDALYQRWLATDWHLSNAHSLAHLLAWASLDQRGAEFLEAMKHPAADGVREELRDRLRKNVGRAGIAVWDAWEAKRGAVALELAILFETLADSSSEKAWVWIQERCASELAVDATEAEQVAKMLGTAVSGALRQLAASGGDAEVNRTLNRADARVQAAPLIVDLLKTNERLPTAWRLRLEALGRLLTEACTSESPSATQVAAAGTLLRSPRSHDLFASSEETRRFERAEMAVRLLAWLSSRSEEAIDGGLSDVGPARALGRWYADEGGFVDRARRWARGSGDSEFEHGIAAVVAKADDRRAALDARFAKGLKAWLESGKVASEVLPIEKAIPRLVAPFLKQNPDRKLLVLLLDGMGWAQATELLESLAERSWAPMTWHRRDPIGEGFFPPVFASVPSITEISRAAFFGSALPKKPNTQDDPKRWADNKHLREFAPEGEVPKLLLRAESHTKSGHASSEALSLVTDTRHRVVAVVLNVIDDSLKANPAQRQRWTVDSIASLSDLLEKAREAGRYVMLASDHGHVPADLLESRTRRGEGGARWLVWESETDAPDDDEIAVPASMSWAPTGAHGVVLPTTDRVRFGGSTASGEHGGASLAEVVAPCVFISWRDAFDASSDDSDTLAVPAPAPNWWHLEVPEPRQLHLVKTLRTGEEKTPAPREPVAIAPVPPRKASAFGKSKILATVVPDETARERVIRDVDYLIERKGAVSAELFARQANLLAFRVSGYVSKLAEVVNLDGYTVIEFDESTREVRLHLERLAQLFEVKL